VNVGSAVWLEIVRRSLVVITPDAAQFFADAR
jgi:hypothetical protein